MTIHGKTNAGINSINIIHGKGTDEKKHDQFLNICVHMFQLHFLL